VGKFWRNKWLVFIIYKIGAVWKNGKPIVTGWARNCADQIPVWAHTTLQMPTEGHRSVTRGRGSRCCTIIADVRDRDRLLSLSFPYKRVMSAEASPFVAFLNNAEVRAPLRSPPASHQLTPPLGDSSRVSHPHFLALLLP
jgi:hypothetical protein